MVGYVYVLSNKGLPGLMKIGSSGKGGWLRRAQLSNTGLPYPFELVFEIFAFDPERIEFAVHDRLDRYRETGNREFFRLDETAATLAVIDTWLYHSGFESNFFAQWNEHIENFYPAQPAPEPTPEEITARRELAEKAREEIRRFLG